MQEIVQYGLLGFGAYLLLTSMGGGDFLKNLVSGVVAKTKGNVAKVDFVAEEPISLDGFEGLDEVEMYVLVRRILHGKVSEQCLAEVDKVLLDSVMKKEKESNV